MKFKECGLFPYRKKGSNETTNEVVLAPIWHQTLGVNRLAVLSAGARTVRGTGPDGMQPRRRSNSSLRAFGRSAPRSRKSATDAEVFFSTKNLDLASRERPCQGGEFQWLSWGRQAAQDTSRRRRAEER
jgi:hypothetical protein